MAIFDKKTISAMTEEQANDMIKEWADHLEVRLKGDDIKAVQDQIWLAVRNERLSFDPTNETFSYVLKSPIEKKDGGSISKILIHEADMSSKRDIDKYKNGVERSAALFKAYCTDSENEQIEFGFLMRIKDRDSEIISAVILGFFVQVVPGIK